MPEPLLESLQRHIKLDGYTIVPEEGNAFSALHDSKPKFAVFPVNNGALFLTKYRLGNGAKSDRVALLEFLNRANGYSVVARFSCETDYMTVAAWFPGSFGVEIFEVFFKQFFVDAYAPIEMDKSSVEKLFRLE